MGKKKVVEQKEEELLKEAKATEAATVKDVKSGKAIPRLQDGRIYINASFNNTVITVTDDKGNVIAWATAGSLGFSGPKKSTPFAASKVAAAVAEKVAKSGPFNIEVFVSGVGPGRDSAVRSLANYGFNILSIRDVTPVPHNGPRPPKIRKV